MKHIRTLLVILGFLALPVLTTVAKDNPGAGAIVLAFELIAAQQFTVKDPAKLVFGELGDNTLGTLSGTIIAQRTLEFLHVMFPMLSRISCSLSPEAALFKQQVTVQIPSAQEAQDWDKDTGYEPDPTAMTQASVTIDQHQHVSFGFNDQEVSATNRNLIDEHAETSAFALGTGLFNFVFALVNPTNIKHEYAVASADFNRRSVIDVNGILNGRGVSGVSRFGIVNSRIMAELLDDTTIVANLYNAVNKDAIAENTGTVIRVHGVDVMEWPNLPSTNNMNGFFGTKQALAVATRVPKDPASVNPGVPIPGKIDIVTDPNTGCSLMVREFYDMKMGKHQVTLTWMFGAALALPLTGQRTVTSASGVGGTVVDVLV